MNLTVLKTVWLELSFEKCKNEYILHLFDTFKEKQSKTCLYVHGRQTEKYNLKLILYIAKLCTIFQ